MVPMFGHLDVPGMPRMNAGFMHPSLAPGVQQVGPSIPIYTRGGNLSERTTELIERMQRFEVPEGIERGTTVEMFGDLASLQKQLGMTLGEITRAITTSTASFPVRENLEAPARNIVPRDTPLRNRLPRTVGAGTASAWRLIASMGGGFGFATTVTSGASSATQTVGSTAGMKVGDVIQFVVASTGVPVGGTVAASLRTVSSITSATVVVLAATIATTTGDLAVNTGKNVGDVVTGSTTAAIVHGRPMGAGGPKGLTAATYFGRSFYAETGAPPDKETTYLSRSAAYKLLGTLGSVTGLVKN